MFWQASRQPGVTCNSKSPRGPLWGEELAGVVAYSNEVSIRAVDDGEVFVLKLLIFDPGRIMLLILILWYCSCLE